MHLDINSGPVRGAPENDTNTGGPKLIPAQCAAAKKAITEVVRR